MDIVLSAATLIAALGCGLIAGVFFAFSTFVMRALSRLPPPEGIAAMQSINVVVLNPVFLSVFVGTAIICVVLIVAALARRQEPGAIWLLAGSALYVFGTFAVTATRNIPLNNTLAALAPAAPESAAYWARYLVDWTFWNHVRGAAALAATVACIMALRLG